MNELPALETLSRISGRWLAILGLLGVVCFAACAGSLHVLQPELSPLNEPMSYYVHGAYGWLITVGLIALGVGSLALTGGVAREAAGAREWSGVAFLAVWSLGAILGGVFAADPPGQWDRPPSVAGAIHGMAAMIALTALPVAAILLSRSALGDRQTQHRSSRATVLAMATVVTYIAFMCSVVPVMVRPGPPVLLGLTQRIMFVAYLAWLAVVALALLRSDEQGLETGGDT